MQKPVAKKKPAPQYASASEVKELSGAVGELMDMVKGLATSIQERDSAPKVQTAEEVKHDAAVTKAGPEISTVNPAWVEKASEILGDALDHCEVFYPKHGGTIFTVVIKQDQSNAPVDYLTWYKADRRSKEIGNEGIDGVEQWCKLVRDNLKRGR